MIRLSTPDDTDAIVRLCLAQYQRTPWPPNGCFPMAQAFHICERAGHIAACCGYRREKGTIRVMHVWGEDGFGGRRSAVELMKDLEMMADAEERDLVFDTMPSNLGLMKAVEEHGCQSTFTAEAVHYRRKARVLV